MAEQDTTTKVIAGRGLSRIDAADYVGIAPDKFDDLVSKGGMPKPVFVGGAPVWDRELLDQAFGVLVNNGESKSKESGNKLEIIKALLDFLKGILWPAVVLFAILVFYSPIHAVLSSVASRANDIQTVKLGYLELQIKASDLPRASKRVADALQKFDGEMVRRLIWLPPTQVEFGHCYVPGNASSENEKTALLKLEALQQVTINRGPKVVDPAPGCKEYWDGKLTQDGIDTREFLFGLLQAQIGTAKSD
jgi:hypothetical protein